MDLQTLEVSVPVVLDSIHAHQVGASAIWLTVPAMEPEFKGAVPIVFMSESCQN